MKIRSGSNVVTDTVIIGAGPYGLSLAAHLQARGLDFQIIGKPMHTWLTQMPKGMRLKSEGFASSLYDPESKFTLGDYCAEKGIPYADIGIPTALEVFASYGMEFQRRFVPQLVDALVSEIQKQLSGFRVTLNTGEVINARRVVVAAGIGNFGFVPPVLSALPAGYVSHSSKHHELEHFAGREIVVVGAGASAVDLAALLKEAGAAVQLVARKPVIYFHNPPSERSYIDAIRSPQTGLGSGWNVFFYCNAPRLFHALPKKMRLRAVQRTLGPAPGWFVKEQVVGKVPVHLGYDIAGADVQNGRVRLNLTNRNSESRSLYADHVIAATGYKVDLRRLEFLNSDLSAQIRCWENAPILSSRFESSVPGLYFIGTSAMNSFGPLMRFAFGAGFAAKRVSAHLHRTASSTAHLPAAASSLEAAQLPSR